MQKTSIERVHTQITRSQSKSASHHQEVSKKLANQQASDAAKRPIKKGWQPSQSNTHHTEKRGGGRGGRENDREETDIYRGMQEEGGGGGGRKRRREEGGRRGRRRRRRVNIILWVCLVFFKRCLLRPVGGDVRRPAETLLSNSDIMTPCWALIGSEVRSW